MATSETDEYGPITTTADLIAATERDGVEFLFAQPERQASALM